MAASRKARSGTGRSSLGAALETNGLVELPRGKIAAIATYLEIRRGEGAAADTPRLPDGLRLVSLTGRIDRYRRLYAAVGRDWLWFSRAALSDAELARIIDDPAVDASALVRDGRDIGIVELDFRSASQCELAFFGLVAEAIGDGLGKVLLREAIRRAFAQPIERLWLHTCTLDHPRALALYQGAGLRPYRRAIELADDPRLTGRLPRDAAPDVPIV